MLDQDHCTLLGAPSSLANITARILTHKSVSCRRVNKLALGLIKFMIHLMLEYPATLQTIVN